MIAYCGFPAATNALMTMLCYPAARSGGKHGYAWSTIAPPRFRCRRYGTSGVPKIRSAAPLQVGGSETLAFLWCSRCGWEIDQASSTRRHGREAANITAALALVAASHGTDTAPRGDRLDIVLLLDPCRRG
jgi:hypothetical protein